MGTYASTGDPAGAARPAATSSDAAGPQPQTTHPRGAWRELLSPCHKQRCRGGPARVWCPVCGRTFQADDIALVS